MIGKGVKEEMNSFDMLLGVSTPSSCASAPRAEESAPDRGLDSDFRKELNSITQKRQKSVKHAQKSCDPEEKPVEDITAQQTADGEAVQPENIAAALGAMMMPMVVIPDPQHEQSEFLPGNTDLLDETTPVVQPSVHMQPIQQMVEPKQQETVPVQVEILQPMVEQSAQDMHSGQETGQKSTLLQQNGGIVPRTVIQQEGTEQDHEPFRAVIQTTSLPAQPLFHNVAGTPIKVAEPVRADLPDFPEHLAQRIGQAVTEGKNTIEVQLAPRALGEITIRLSISAQGTMVTLHSTNPKTLTLLAAHAANIGSIVEQYSHGDVSVQVQRDQPNTQQQYTQQERQGNGQHQHQQQQQQQHRAPPQTDDFIQQFRLGLVEYSAMQ